MTISQFAKSCLTFTFIALISVQMSACGSSGTQSDVATSTGTGTGTGTTNTVSNIALSWVAPSSRTDNQPIALSDIAGYKAYYGKQSGQYTSSIDINDGTAVSYTLKNIPVGTYYLAMTTYDINGLESDYSPEVVVKL